MTEDDKRDQELQKAQREAEGRTTQLLIELLLDKGLYAPVEVKFPIPVVMNEWPKLWPKVVNAPCSRCTHVQTTSWRISLEAHTHRTCFGECMSCEGERVTYYLHSEFTPHTIVHGTGGSAIKTFRHVKVTKVGQFPAWNAPIPELMRKALGKNGIDLYVKGASSLRVGRGIGAVAYFRRIVEEHVDDLLNVIEEAATAQGDTVTAERIKAANNKFRATERLEIASEHTPHILRPGGHNPIEVLYNLLSDGLHNKSDEENAVVASRAQKALAYFFETWGAFKERSQEFAGDIAKQATKSNKT